MRSMVLDDLSTDGDDTVSGFDNSDTFEAGLGADTVTGNRGNDVYVYTRGDGNDRFNEYRYHDWDRVVLHNIDPSDVTLRRESGNNVTLVIAESAPGAGDGGEIFLYGGHTGSLVNSQETGFERIDFDDGTQWTPATMRELILSAAATDGDDIITGFDNSDVFRGGLGDDTIYGDDGNDRYIYARGDGNDTYGDWRHQETDTVEFVDILQHEVIFYSSGNHVYAKVLDSFDGANDGSVLMFRESMPTNSEGIDILQFADGSTMTDDTFVAQRYTVGTAANDVLAGGTGNDRLFGDYGDDQLTGGLGDDVLNGSYGVDTAVYSGLSTEFTILTNNGVVQLQDDETATGDNEGTDTLIGIETLLFSDGVSVGITSPIILDLAGDGIQTLSADQSDALFDLDGDGLADDTSWIGTNDAFLYLDRDGNGTMSGVEEISFIGDVPNAATDLDGLAAFDSNSDGILDASDDRFADFGVWQDADGDGAVDEGETVGLEQVGIASIHLTGNPVNGGTEFGEVVIANTGEFTLTNGATLNFADAALTYFAAASTLPEISATDYSFDRKAKKYRIHFSGGLVSVDRKKRGANISQGAGQLGANTILDFDGQSFGRFAPVVLDLDNDGIDLVRRSKSSAVFDYQGLGDRVDTGWISGGDAFLVIDRNNDGLITEASELSLAAEDGQARTGLQGLARLDSNGDGVVDADDARFGELRVWQDANGNGRTDEGELRTLAQEGIASVSLGAFGLQGRVKVTKNALTAVTTFTRTNGATGTAGDVSLAFQPAKVPAETAAFEPVELGLAGDVPVPAHLSGQFQGPVPDLDEVFDQLRAGTDAGLSGLFDRLDPVETRLWDLTVAQRAVDQSFGAVALGWENSSLASFGQFDLMEDRRLAAGFERYLSSDSTAGAVFAGGAEEGLTYGEQPEASPEESPHRTAQADMAQVPLASIDENENGAGLSPSGTARKLMIIRQELSVFGAEGGSETLRLRDGQREYLEIFA